MATVNDYNQLMKDFPLNDLLSATELDRIRVALSAIFIHLRKIRPTKYPIQRCLRLVEAISRDLSSQLLKVWSNICVYKTVQCLDPHLIHFCCLWQHEDILSYKWITICTNLQIKSSLKIVSFLFVRCLELVVWCIFRMRSLRKWWQLALRYLELGMMSMKNSRVCWEIWWRRREKSIFVWCGELTPPTNASRLD